MVVPHRETRLGLAPLRPKSVIVWAVISQRMQRGHERIRLDLRHAKYFACCEGEYVAGGSYQMTGTGPRGAYAVIIRIYFGSPATPALRAQAQRALNLLQLPRRRQTPRQKQQRLRPASTRHPVSAASSASVTRAPVSALAAIK